MHLRRWLVASVMCLGVSGASLLWAQSQEGAGQAAVSLGDLARQLKSRRASERKPTKVYTNDNLPTGPATSGVSVAAQMSLATEEPRAEEAESAEGSTGESSGAHNEKYYRKTMSELRSRLEIHKRELAVLEQRLAQSTMQFYPDPNKTLQQEYSRSDITKLQQDLEKKKQEIAADEQAIGDLQEQLRREGAPPGWLR